MISLTMSREDWRTGSIPELPLLRMQKFNKQKGEKMQKEKKTPQFETFGISLTDNSDANKICLEIYQILTDHKLNARDGKLICKTIINSINTSMEKTKLEL